MNSVVILVKDKTVYIHFGEILDQCKLHITNPFGRSVFNKQFAKSHYMVISLDQPGGKYWLSIDSETIKTKKSFLLK